MDPRIEDWKYALDLDARLGAGQGPQPLPSPEYAPGEPVYVHVVGRIEEHTGMQLAFGQTAGRHALAEEWRTLMQGNVLLTPARIVIPGRPEMSLGWSGLDDLYPDFNGVFFRYGSQRFALRVPHPVWLHCMIRAVAFQQRAVLDPPQWIRSKLGR